MYIEIIIMDEFAELTQEYLVPCVFCPTHGALIRKLNGIDDPTWKYIQSLFANSKRTITRENCKIILKDY